MIHFHRYSEYLQHWLFKAIRKTAMEKTKGKCALCSQPATEVHHLKYPKPWGTFDIPKNLQPICHACHCRVEGITQ